MLFLCIFYLVLSWRLPCTEVINMPMDAMPERLQNPDNWKGTDMDNWYQRWILKYVHGWFAYGPRSKRWWAKWQVPPKNLLKLGGDKNWRLENDPWTGFKYISRIQYWKRWHVQVHWPFMFAFHFYFKESDVLPTSVDSGASVDGKLFYFYIGAHYDQDCVYWFPSAFAGLTWK